MTLQEAIEIKETELDGTVEHSDEELREADALSISALKRCKVLAENSPLWAAKPLPGETED